MISADTGTPQAEPEPAAATPQVLAASRPQAASQVQEQAEAASSVLPGGTKQPHILSKGAPCIWQAADCSRWHLQS